MNFKKAGEISKLTDLICKLILNLAHCPHSLCITKGSEIMKGALANIATIIASFVLLITVASAQGVTSQAESRSQHATAQALSSSGPSSGAAAGMGMMGQGTMSGPGMMGHHMMGGPGGMMPGGMVPGCMMDTQMLMNDPKTRGQMMEIHGRMMQEMGELMQKRGKELEQAK